MKYVLVNWSFNEKGRWLSISSTDYEAAHHVADLCIAYIKSYRRIRYDKFSKEGGLAMIEGIETHLQKSDINAFLMAFFVQEGWKADKRNNYSFSKTS